MAKYIAELGCSPVSRSRVEAKPLYRKKLWEFGREWVDPRSKFAGLLGPTRTTRRRVLPVRQRASPVRSGGGLGPRLLRACRKEWDESRGCGRTDPGTMMPHTGPTRS